ncbi:MAG: class I SAM-dependent methyltransferase [Bacteroidia bacterium]|nr:class I SAM-dependent methyltransferase [Bacteroidia bacterium]
MSFIHKNCLICNSTNLTPYSIYYAKGLIKCRNCSFVFMEKLPTEEELKSHYETYSYAVDRFVSPLTIESYNALLDEFEKFRKTNQILDIGCGTGYFLIEAQKRGWKTHGTEYSPKAIEILKEKGIEPHYGKISNIKFADESFDVITCFEVLEHLSNPNEDIKHIHRLLRINGLFYCTTPNFNSIIRYYLKTDYDIIEYPEHLCYFTKRTLNLLMTRNGFKNIKFLVTGISINRLIPAKVNSKSKISDENLFQNLNKSWYLKLLKKMLNFILNITDLGMTLKGYYVKN